MFCKNCGSQISDHAFICVKCGAKVREVSKQKKYTGLTLGIIASSLEAFQLVLMLSTIYSYTKNASEIAAALAFILFYIPCSISVFVLSVIGTTFGFKSKSKAGSILNLIALIVCILAFVGFILYFQYNSYEYNYYY